MIYSPFAPFEVGYGLAFLVILAAAVLVMVVLVRLILAATRALNAITEDRSVRTALLLAGGETDETDGEPREPDSR